MGRHFKVKIKAFRAIDNEELSQKYLKGHRNVLRLRGFEHFASGNEQWMYNPNVYCFLAVSYSNPNKLYGGLRVEVKDRDLIPLEQVLASRDIRVIQKVQEAAKDRTGELCGHWNIREVAGRGLGRILAIAAFSTLDRLNLKSVFAFNASYTIRITRMLGMEHLKDIGDNGYFRYPTERFRAYLWFKEDIYDLSQMHEFEAKRIKSLRENPNQVFLEEECSKGLMVYYELEF